MKKLVLFLIFLGFLAVGTYYLAEPQADTGTADPECFTGQLACETTPCYVPNEGGYHFKQGARIFGVGLNLTAGTVEADVEGRFSGAAYKLSGTITDDYWGMVDNPAEEVRIIIQACGTSCTGLVRVCGYK